MNTPLSELGISPEQIENLLKLASHLETLREERFDMADYLLSKSGYPINPYDKIHKCGTVGCAIGNGPLAGLPTTPQDYTWESYSIRVFGIQAGYGYIEYSSLYTWLFSHLWAVKLNDGSKPYNTPKGAARRIRYAVSEGLPRLKDRRAIKDFTGYNLYHLPENFMDY